MKKVRILAGPNGSGKTTLFEALSKIVDLGSFVNADIIEKTLTEKRLVDLIEFGLAADQKDWDSYKNTTGKSLVEKAVSAKTEFSVVIRENCIVCDAGKTTSYEAALLAAFLRDLLITSGKKFCFETVMSHPSKLEEIVVAKDQGYKIYLYFVCIDDPSINISRIGNRVNKGGHAVDDQYVLSRYEKTLGNLYSAICLADRVYLLDNSGRELEVIAEIHDGAMEVKTDHLPQWFLNHVIPHFV